MVTYICVNIVLKAPSYRLIIKSNADFSLVNLCGIHLKVIWTNFTKAQATLLYNEYKHLIILLKSLPHFPGVNELNESKSCYESPNKKKKMAENLCEKNLNFFLEICAHSWKFYQTQLVHSGPHIDGLVQERRNSSGVTSFLHKASKMKTDTKSHSNVWTSVNTTNILLILQNIFTWYAVTVCYGNFYVTFLMA